MTPDECLATWEDVVCWFDTDVGSSVLVEIAQQERSGHKHYPPVVNVLDPHSCAPWWNIRVVIVGTKPYADADSGIAFSSITNQHRKSLENLFLECELDAGVRPPDGSLSGWTKQGVMLLNVEMSKAISQPPVGWSSLLDKTLTTLSMNSLGVVFVFLGDVAKHHAIRINRASHHVIMLSDPVDDPSGFFGHRMFTRVNKYLQNDGFDPIDWGA